MTDVAAAFDSDRIISLEGGQNFREIGGYPTLDGRRLRRRQLWRSAKLDELTVEDVAIIRSLGIATIADLRRQSEREASPTHEAIATNARVLTWDVPFSKDERPDKLFQSCEDPAEYVEVILALYRRIAEDHVQHLRELYHAVAGGNTPILIHCAAGKDRTGIAVGLLLDLLGVDRRYVIADYVKTQDLLDWQRLTKSAAAGTGVAVQWLERMDPVASDILSRSDARYLSAAFEDLEARYGSTTNFAIERLELDPATIERMGDHLLESAEGA